MNSTTRLRENQRVGVGSWDVNNNRHVYGYLTVAEVRRIFGEGAVEKLQQWESAARNGHGNPLAWVDHRLNLFLVPPGFFARDGGLRVPHLDVDELLRRDADVEIYES